MDTTLNLDTTFAMSGVPVYSGSGPGAVTYTETGMVESIMVNMADPGIYYFTVEAQDDVGAVHSDTVAVLAMDKTELDALLKAKWDGMKSAMIAGDVEGGLSYFLQRSQDKYRLIFSELLDHLPDIYSNMQGISMIYCEDGIAKYRINRTQIINGSAVAITYYIYFAVDGDGLFKTPSRSRSRTRRATRPSRASPLSMPRAADTLPWSRTASPPWPPWIPP